MKLAAVRMPVDIAVQTVLMFKYLGCTVLRAVVDDPEPVHSAIEEPKELRVFHAPILARSTLARRAEFGERIAAAYSSPNTGWHMRRTTQLAGEGRLNAEWAGNSQRFGRLNLGGRSRPLVRDLRLKKAIAAFL